MHKLINKSYGYDVSRVGDKKKDFEKSNIVFKETKNYKYKIVCKGCNQEFYRQRLNRNLLENIDVLNVVIHLKYLY